MHNIQKEILKKLTINSPLQFSQIQPDNLANNIFAYHLKKLVDTGYVIHTGNHYMASRKALKEFHFESTAIKDKQNPKLLTALYVTAPDGKVLLYKRNNEPFKNWFGIPSGLVHFGEQLEDAAKRELLEKTGISISRPLKNEGIIDFRYMQNESKDIFVHAVCSIFSYLKTREFDLPSNCKWSNLTESKILPEVLSIRDIVYGKEPLFKSVDFTEPTKYD